MDIIQKGKRGGLERIRESGGVTEQVKRGFAKECPTISPGLQSSRCLRGAVAWLRKPNRGLQLRVSLCRLPQLVLAPATGLRLDSFMIAFVRGTLVEALPHEAVVEVSGVGYCVLIPLSTFDRLPQIGGEVKLLTHHHVTEREESLFGFGSADERDLFRLLIDRVSGIGPKMALAVLSGMPVAAFKEAVIQNDVKALSRIKGLGTKTAERIVLELKDKVGVVSVWQDAESARIAHDGPREAQTDAVLGLIALGYKQIEAQKAIQAVVKHSGTSPNATADQLIREALRMAQ